MDVFGWIGAGIGIAALAVSIVSAVAAWLARRDTRRSADASERSAGVAERTEQQREKERHEAEGPEFESSAGIFGPNLIYVHSWVKGGPGLMDLEIDCIDLPWVCGMSSDGQDPMLYPLQIRARPEERVSFWVHTSDDAPIEHGRAALPVSITATSSENASQSWTRIEHVRLGW